MKTVLVLSCMLAACFAADLSKYENFDVEPIVTSDRLLKAYINCFLDKGRCTPEAADFKKALPDTIATNCGKCTEKQKTNVRKVIKVIQQKHSTEWDQLVKKHDPSEKHRADFDKFLQGS